MVRESLFNYDDTEEAKGNFILPFQTVIRLRKGGKNDKVFKENRLMNIEQEVPRAIGVDLLSTDGEKNG